MKWFTRALSLNRPAVFVQVQMQISAPMGREQPYDQLEGRCGYGTVHKQADDDLFMRLSALSSLKSCDCTVLNNGALCPLSPFPLKQYSNYYGECCFLLRNDQEMQSSSAQGSPVLLLGPVLSCLGFCVAD